MHATVRLFLLSLGFLATTAWGQAAVNEPRVGYLYPAGGQQGTSVQVLVGGQRLKGVFAAHVSGQGVGATVVQYYPPFRRLDREQQKELRRRLKELKERRHAELEAGENPDALTNAADPSPLMLEEVEETTKPTVSLPQHPMLENLDQLSLKELQCVTDEFFDRGKRQPNAQLGEMVVIELDIEPGAAPGDRQLRLQTRAGLTNPICLQVGSLPEAREQEPNDPCAPADLPAEPVLDLPVLLNGQIMPGDIDRFRFRARRGERLVIDAHARRLIPYLADAVPGWFQATIALYDAQGREVAYDDDYRFEPDPVLFYEVPNTGEYSLEIRDAIYRGREDFVYRVAVGPLPFITEMFPLGGAAGVKTVAAVAGWNLPGDRLPLDTSPGAEAVRSASLRRDGRISNEVPYAVDTLPESLEIEPNDAVNEAASLALPGIVNGHIAKPGDVDRFRFEGRAGDSIVAEVIARRLHSSLDSVLTLADASGDVLAWNDDRKTIDAGRLTHHADSYLMTTLPKDGGYVLRLTDAQHQGGAACAYRLRVGPPRPDFALRMVPSTLNLAAGRATPITFHVLRKDGFDGPIEISLKDPPAGFALHGATIPGNRDTIRMTLLAPDESSTEPMVLHLEGHAGIGDDIVTRPAVPAEDMMQAFIYRHLVPSEDLMVAVLARKGPPLRAELTAAGPVPIPAGGSARVWLKLPRRGIPRDIQLDLSDPPQGVTIHAITTDRDGLAFELQADAAGPAVGYADNLIVQVFREVTPPARDGKPAAKPRRSELGVLPAIPIRIVQR
jgi:hypothetical protein